MHSAIPRLLHAVKMVQFIGVTAFCMCDENKSFLIVVSFNEADIKPTGTSIQQNFVFCPNISGKNS